MKCSLSARPRGCRWLYLRSPDAIFPAFKRISQGDDGTLCRTRPINGNSTGGLGSFSSSNGWKARRYLPKKRTISGRISTTSFPFLPALYYSFSVLPFSIFFRPNLTLGDAKLLIIFVFLLKIKPTLFGVKIYGLEMEDIHRWIWNTATMEKRGGEFVSPPLWILVLERHVKSLLIPRGRIQYVTWTWPVTPRRNNIMACYGYYADYAASVRSRMTNPNWGEKGEAPALVHGVYAGVEGGWRGRETTH